MTNASRSRPGERNGRAKLTAEQVREIIRDHRGYGADRVRFDDGTHDSDWSVLVERTDGLPPEEILTGWER